MSEVVIKGRHYVVGLDRLPVDELRGKSSHLYRGTFNRVGWPMCRRGWNRDGGTAFSIWRGHVGAGICRACTRRAEAKRDPVPPADPGGEG